MRIAVLEFLSGGGLMQPIASGTNQLSGASQLSGLYAEGLAMLTGLATDLVRCDHQVFTCLDPTAFADPTSLSVRDRASICIEIASTDWIDTWTAISLKCDRTIVIAPELDNQLERIVGMLRSHGTDVLASTAEFLSATSDKLRTSQLLLAAGVAHPVTTLLGEHLRFLEGDEQMLNENSPLTLKRRDGAGCLDMRFFPNNRLLKEWHETSGQALLGHSDDWIVQPWLEGQPASMAILAGSDWRVLGAVEQRIRLSPIDKTNRCAEASVSAVEFLGCKALTHRIEDGQLNEFATRVKNALPEGGAGWIGIDFLIPTDNAAAMELVAIEINPRLTTSYLEYRDRYGAVLADELVQPTGRDL